MRYLLSIATAASLIVAASVVAAPSLSGQWEVQSMGADRKIKLQQKGNKLVAHRVMWPTFEGEKYKLEHLYRGTITGKKISGQLLVKEEDLPEYEVLRGFKGSIGSNNKIILDGLPMKRIGKAKGSTPDAAPKGRNSPPPSYSKAESQPSPAPPPATGSTETEHEALEADESATLFESIMVSPGMGQENLFQVSNRITIPNPVADLTDEGDALYRKKNYKEALAKFKRAASLSKTTHVELVYRMGRCHLKLKNYRKATKLLGRALRLDPQNSRLRQDYNRAKQEKV